MGNYSGNKKLHSEPILLLLNDPKFDGMKYLEPFLGMGHILRRVKNKSSYHASDYSPYIYHIMNALQRTNDFPTISRSIFEFLKERKDRADLSSDESWQLRLLMDPEDLKFTFEELRAFSALATFRSIPWSTFQGNRPEESRDWQRVRESDYEMLLESDTFQVSHISHKDYKTYSDNIHDTVIYCDSPYARSEPDNVRFYGQHTASFRHEEFWEKVRRWSDPRKNNAVFVSEYHAPADFVSVVSFAKHGALGKKNRERVFMWEANYIHWQNHHGSRRVTRSRAATAA